MNTLILILLNASTDAASAVPQIMGSGNIYNDILLVVLIIFMTTVLVAALTILKALRTIVRITMPGVEEQQKAAKKAAKADRKAKRKLWWSKLMGLHALDKEEDLIIDHEYDGIKELDNPVPLWFNGLFYATVAFAVVYLFVYHVFGVGMNQHQEYEQEMAHAEKARLEYLAQAANLVDESTVEVDASLQTLNAGQALYTLNCAVCHGQAGEGGIGPNLTDEYWLHGGEISDVFRIVKYGVLDKGMVPWEQSLTPAQIAEVSNYVLSLRGTNPPNPKEPQGQKVEYKVIDTEGGQEVVEAAAIPVEAAAQGE